MKDYTGILFLDIETVPLVEHFEELDERLQLLFKKKFLKEINNFEESMLQQGNWESDKQVVNEVWQRHAALHAEFGKVVCISVGIFIREGGQLTGQQKFYIKAITNSDERALLEKFATIVKENSPNLIVSHNGINFDVPFLCRRMTLMGIRIPHQINPQGKKAWELNHDDTMVVWAFGEWGKKISLDLLSAILGIPSPKEIMDGSQVSTYFYKFGTGMPTETQEQGLQAIGYYCNGDVITLAKVYLRLCGDLDEVVLLNP